MSAAAFTGTCKLIQSLYRNSNRVLCNAVVSRADSAYCMRVSVKRASTLQYIQSYSTFCLLHIQEREVADWAMLYSGPVHFPVFMYILF